MTLDRDQRQTLLMNVDTWVMSLDTTLTELEMQMRRWGKEHPGLSQNHQYMLAVAYHQIADLIPQSMIKMVADAKEKAENA